MKIFIAKFDFYKNKCLFPSVKDDFFISNLLKNQADRIQ